MQQNKYDWIIVGGGPVGLTLAWLLATGDPDTQKILVIEKEQILGGCHRVRRVRRVPEDGRGTSDATAEIGLFTEHGPRIYSNAYVNFRQILTAMGLDFEKLFIPYEFTTGAMSTSLIGKLSWREFSLLALEFFKLVINPDHGQDITVEQFTKSNNFSPSSQDELDRACRLTDGAGADRYTVFELLSIFDQHLFYTFYLPRRPNDLGLFRLWEQKLRETGKVDFLLDTEVKHILTMAHGDNGASVIGIVAENESSSEKFTIPGQQVILGIPPENAVPLLLEVAPNLSSTLIPFEQESRYDTYIPVIFHWDRKITLPKIWGFPDTSWGVISMLLSDYTVFDNSSSRTVISTCITMTDKPSLTTGLTADQTRSREEIVAETFRQLNEVYGGTLPSPTASILSPGVFYAEGWRTRDSAFVLTPAGFLPEQNIKGINGLHWVGTHNGRSRYHFTAFESAVTNALAFYLENIPGAESRGNYRLLGPVGLSGVIRYIIILAFLAYLTNRFIL